jgi:HSP20 family protein
MDLVKWEPFKELSTLHRQMNRFMDTFWDKETFPGERWTPALDVTETPEEIVVKADVPGIEEKDLSVRLSGDNLIIKGERSTEKEEKDKHFHRVERSFGSFQRIVALPVAVDADNIKAECHKGVLELHLPKKAEAKAKEIPIHVKK